MLKLLDDELSINVFDLHANLQTILHILIDFFQQYLARGFNTVYMYWPQNDEKGNCIFLLAKNIGRGSEHTVTKVYVSKNYGKNFTDLNIRTKSGKTALIDQIYSSKPDPKLVSTHVYQECH